MSAHSSAPRHDSSKKRAPTSEPNTASRAQDGVWSRLTTVPGPVKKLFDATPLGVYPRNELPVRARRREKERRVAHTLWVWTKEGNEDRGGMSFNPGCLKWQAYLKFLGLHYTNVASNNHASPSGALPFLIPKTQPGEASTAMPTSKLRRWALKESKLDESRDTINDSAIDQARYDAYISLIDHRIRRAWLYTLHHTPLFASLTTKLYIHPTSTSIFIRHSLSTSLLDSATTELQKHTPVIIAKDIYAEAEEAFAALENLLGEHEWFFGKNEPGWFDACVFAYTGLILRGTDDDIETLQERDGWNALSESYVGAMLRERHGLRRHRQRILKGWFEGVHE